MQVDRNQFLEQGYLILRNVVPPNELEALRESYEILVERQRALWARDRAPGDPPGGVLGELPAAATVSQSFEEKWFTAN